MPKKLGDPIIALTVVACSVVLLLALAFALHGNPFDRPSRTLRAQLQDITGLQTSSLVKYEGARAGDIRSVRMLTPEERRASKHPENTIEIVIALDDIVPELNEGLTASIASDTLLSDKFLLLAGGNPQAAVLPDGATIPGVSPVTFDSVLRDLGGLMAKMRGLFDQDSLHGLEGLIPLAQKTLTELGEIVGAVKNLLGAGNGLLTDASSMVRTGDGLLADGRALLNDNGPAVTRLLAQLSRSADTLDALAKRADELLKKTGPNLDASAREARALLSELKETATSAHALVDQLRARPQSLLWGPGRAPKPPASER